MESNSLLFQINIIFDKIKAHSVIRQNFIGVQTFRLIKLGG